MPRHVNYSHAQLYAMHIVKNIYPYDVTISMVIMTFFTFISQTSSDGISLAVGNDDGFCQSAHSCLTHGSMKHTNITVDRQTRSA